MCASWCCLGLGVAWLSPGSVCPKKLLMLFGMIFSQLGLVSPIMPYDLRVGGFNWWHISIIYIILRSAAVGVGRRWGHSDLGFTAVQDYGS